MKITKSQLRRIIKEELSNTLKEFVDQPSDEEKLGMQQRCAASARKGTSETRGECMKRELAAWDLNRDPMQHAGPGGAPTAVHTGRRYQEGAKNEELSTEGQVDCNKITKAYDDYMRDESADVSGRGYGEVSARAARQLKIKYPKCFPEAAKTTQEPEAAMGPEGPIMKKTFQERNKMTKGRLKQIIKEELLKEITADQARQMADYADELAPKDKCGQLRSLYWDREAMARGRATGRPGASFWDQALEAELSRIEAEMRDLKCPDIDKLRPMQPKGTSQ